MFIKTVKHSFQNPELFATGYTLLCDWKITHVTVEIYYICSSNSEAKASVTKTAWRRVSLLLIVVSGSWTNDHTFHNNHQSGRR